MPFGKFRGTAVEETPSSYLCWCLENCSGLSPMLEISIRRELAARFGGGGRPVRDQVNAWYRRLALRFHPDRGGTDRDMAVVNVARDELEAALGLG